MTYRAYLDFSDRGTVQSSNVVRQAGRLRIFPRSRKTACFASIDAARKMLERKTRVFGYDTRGLVYDGNGQLVYTIAL